MTFVDTSNPWAELSQTPYVLPADAPIVHAFNAKWRNTDYELKLDVLPDVFIGNPDAPIWLLNLNPGFKETDLTHPPHVVAVQRRNLLLEVKDFWYLDPTYSDTSGHTWWNNKTKKLQKEFGRNSLMSMLFCVEFFPYHSVKFKRLETLPSQKFTFDLVRAGCRAGKRFIFMRSFTEWTRHVPELKGADYLRLNNVRSPSISRTNVCHPDKFDLWLKEASQ